MAPNTKRWIDKKSSETYQLRYRSQADPLIHDSTAPDFVFTPVAAPNTKIKNATQLSTELAASGAAPPRKNEGEAAMYGIYYDDTAYDYMQHLREPGAAEAVVIDAKAPKPKGKTDLAAALAAPPEAHEQEPRRLIPKELMASEVQLQRTWRDQQDVQDEIRGFRPDMDPRLREVLEALEDEAYVDDDEDIFGQLAEGGEATPGEFYDGGDFWDEEEEEEDGGWESDATEKPGEHQKAKAIEERAAADKKAEAKVTDKMPEVDAAAAPAADDNAWMSEFSKFKKAEKRNKKMAGGGDDDASSMADTMSFGGASSFGGTMSISGRTRRRHKKAGTESSGYSMTSSSLFRTEGLTTLDARFDKIEEEYAEDSEEEEEDGAPAVPVPETRQDFNSIMDEFLEGYNVVGRNNPRVRKGKALTGLEQLDEIRQGLGKARISERPAKRASRVR
ncbi:Low temperature viability protein [Morchella snyderi]|nr:Low temperature viability protein [Morchella snyderi]